MHRSKKLVSKFVAKILRYRILFKDIPTFFGLDYSYASLITLYLVVIGIIIGKKKAVWFPLRISKYKEVYNFFFLNPFI